jgi:hypothetical protein
MSKMSVHQKLLEATILRILKLSRQNQPFVLREDGEVLFEFNIGELIHLDKGKLNIDLGQVGLKTKGNLVGMSGFYYNPKIFWGGNVENVIDSWNWLLKMLGVDVWTFQGAIEGEAVLEFLFTGHEEGLIFYFFSLLVDLYELNSVNIEINSKIAELKRQVRGHIKSYKKLKNGNIPEAFSRITKLRMYLANLSSECRLARLATLYGFDVKLGIHPDLTVNNKKIEVKRVRSKYLSSKLAHAIPQASLSNPIREGLVQNPDIIAIQVNNLEKRAIKGFKATWLARDRLKNVLEKALTYKGKAKLIVLFLGTNRGYFGRTILLKELSC